MPVNAFRSLPFRARRRWEFLQRFTKVPLEPISIITLPPARGRRRVPHRAHRVHGEDGFEIYFAPEHSEKLWSNLLEAGASQAYCPAAWEHETHCVWKRRCASMATKSTTPRLRGRLAGLDCKPEKENSTDANSNPPKSRGVNALSSV